MLGQWLRSYHPDELFDADGALMPELAALAPTGDKRMSATRYANGGRLLKPLDIPALDRYALDVAAPGQTSYESTRPLGGLIRDIYRWSTNDIDGGGTFRLFCPDETNSNRLGAVFEVTDRCWQLPVLPTDDNLSPDGRVVEVLSEHLCEGWLEGYLLSGRHGIFATYEAFAMVSASMLVQHTKWLQHAADLPWRTPIASLNVLLTSTCWRNDHNGFSHQGPGLIDTAIPLAPGVVRIWFPPDANCALSITPAADWIWDRTGRRRVAGRVFRDHHGERRWHAGAMSGAPTFLLDSLLASPFGGNIAARSRGCRFDEPLPKALRAA